MELTFILKIVVVVLGVLTVGLTALTFSKPFPHPGGDSYTIKKIGLRQSSKACQDLVKANLLKTQEEQDKLAYSYPSTCYVKKHVILDELVFSIIVIALIFSIALLALSFILKNPEKKKTIDMIFYIVAGVLLLLMAILWFMSVANRTFALCKTNEDGTLVDKDCTADAEKKHDIDEFYGNNIIKLGISSKNKERLKESKTPYLAEGTLAIVCIDGILILVNAFLYIGIGVLTLKKPAGGGQVMDYNQPQEDQQQYQEEPGEVLGM